MNIEIFIVLIAFFILYFIIDSFFSEYQEIRIVFLGIIVSSFMYIMSRNIQEQGISKMLGVLSIITLIITVLFVIILYVGKITGKNNQ